MLVDPNLLIRNEQPADPSTAASQVWGLLFRALGSSECFGLTGFASKWTLRVVVLPVILSLIVATIYCMETRTNPIKAGSHAKGNGFFAVFFVSLSPVQC